MSVFLISSVAMLTTMAGHLIPTAPGYSRPQQGTRLSQTKDQILLIVSGEVEHPLKLTASDLGALPQMTVRAKEHSGEEAVFDGVALIEILKMSGMKFGESMRGKALSIYLVVKASDNYQVVLTPPELDPVFTDRIILLASKKNGAPLPAAEGPLRIVVPDEKRQARWVRNVISISVRHAE